MGMSTEQLSAIAFAALASGGKPGEDGRPGKDGAIFTPEISDEGVLSWTNNGGLENPEPVMIRGESLTFDDLTEEEKGQLKGEKGDPGDSVTITEIPDEGTQIAINGDEVTVPGKANDEEFETFLDDLFG